jgi:predicted RNA-binding protein with PUA-like domain
MAAARSKSRSKSESKGKSKSHWLIKSEPAKYAWDRLVADGSTRWDGVRNYEARNNLAAMKKGDLLLYYHSTEGKEIVGVARVAKEAYPDPTSDDERWVAVDVAPVKALAKPVGLQDVKQDPQLREMALVRRGRISVVPVTPDEFRRVLALAGTSLPR